MKRIGGLQALFACAAAGWAAAVVLAPLDAGPSGGPPRLATAVYMAGAVVCHQKPERSFRLAGRTLPVCARCTGIYLAAAVTAVGMLFTLRGPRSGERRLPAPGLSRLVMALALLPTAATLVWEWTTGVVPSNGVRALAGFPIGVAVAWIVSRATVATAQSE